MTKRVMRYGWAALVMLFCAAAAPAQAQDGWVTILDASSFKDWKVAPESPKSRVEESATEKRVVAGDSLHDGRWTFKDGVLHGEGGVSHIFSPRGDYENFLYRAEVKINDKGNSGQYFRTEFGNGFPNGYEAQVNSTHTDPVAHRQPLRLREGLRPARARPTPGSPRRSSPSATTSSSR